MATSKLQLLIELKDKLKMGLDGAKKKVAEATGGMQKKLDAFSKNNIEAFSAIKEEVPGVGRAITLLTNPYVLAAAAVVGLGLAVASATSKAMEFEHVFMNIRQLNLDKSRSELDQYRRDIADSALVTGVNLNEMTSGYYDLQSGLGVYGKDARLIAEQVGKYSISTQANFNDSINQTVKAMKAFGLGAGDVKGLLESNAKTVQVGIVTYAELARVQTEYAGAAAAAGQGIDTANKLFAAFTGASKNAEIGANLTKSAFEGLVQPQVIKGLSQYVKMYDDATGKMRPLENILQDTTEKIKGMNDVKFHQFMGDVGGPDGVRRLFSTLRTGADDFFKTLKAYDQSPVSLDKMYENALQDPATASKVVKEQFNTMFTSFGLLFLPIVTKVSSLISSIILGFRNLYKESQLFRDVLSFIGGFFSVTLKIALAPIRMIINGFKNMWAIGSAIVTTLGDWAAKITGVEGGFVGLYNSIRPYLVWIKDMMGQIASIGYDFITMNFKGAWDKVKAFKVPQLGDIRAKIATESHVGDFAGISALGGGGSGAGSGQDTTVTTSTNDLQSVTRGGQSKNITINIDSFIKSFTPTQDAINGMSKDQLDRWFTDMFLRVVNSAEQTA